MGRPRMFDEKSVLDAAAGEFRVHGFTDTSTEQLCEAAGVRRSTLYNTFTSKDELFVRALQHYLETTSAAQREVLGDESLNGIERLYAYFDLMIGEEVCAAEDGHAAGCMAIGTRMTPDIARRDDRIKRLLDKGLSNQLSALSLAVRQGQADGSISKNVAPENAAQLIASLVAGLRVMAQAGRSPDELRSMTSLGLTALLP
ncbi:HTH-type transcriptional repressor ComR [Corynebacterium glaucum]|uniref:TetR/AcrR family transcriptional regulator n=1 Tax=Corynebacterium glaucum TaxID=187491 RepID=UPI0025B4C41D|nr:TetR/AcrR family transcriptional regulator [Corynebacterium glaucum]WJZ07256.1 HTH-type transcriptional repressor ComR [Corynebacterium glaucum]